MGSAVRWNNRPRPGPWDISPPATTNGRNGEIAGIRFRSVNSANRAEYWNAVGDDRTTNACVRLRTAALTTASKSLQFAIETVWTSTANVNAAASIARSCDLPLVVSHSRLI